MVTMADIYSVAHTTRDAVNRLNARGVLPTELEPMRQGVARSPTRENALAIVFHAAAIRGGVPAPFAAQLVKGWIAEEAAGTLVPLWAWNPKDDPSQGVNFGDASLGFRDFAIALADDVPGGYAGVGRRETIPATEIVVIDRGELARRVDALFAEPGK
jgi:hypothetical protein